MVFWVKCWKITWNGACPGCDQLVVVAEYSPVVGVEWSHKIDSDFGLMGNSVMVVDVFVDNIFFPIQMDFHDSHYCSCWVHPPYCDDYDVDNIVVELLLVLLTFSPATWWLCVRGAYLVLVPGAMMVAMLVVLVQHIVLVQHKLWVGVVLKLVYNDFKFLCGETCFRWNRGTKLQVFVVDVLKM